jgi:squalene-associated FAD-dependent desaturase
MARTVHIIGAGLAGLSAAAALAARGDRVVVHEATAFAGGRCRSYHDAAVGMTIDNGNHLLLSGNRAALEFLRMIGAAHRLIGPPAAEFPFVDLKTNARWTLRFNNGRVPLWIFDAKRRVPGTGVSDYLSLARLLWPGAGKTVGETIACKGPLYARLIEPFLLAALNIDPPDGSAKLAAAVIRETLAAGGRACRPLIARDGLAATLIDPALDYLRGRGTLIKLEHQLRAMRFGAQRVEALDFGDEIVALADSDAVILAVPPYAAASLVQGLSVPNEFRAIVNAHFRIDPPVGQPPVLGVLNATTQWIFAFPGRLSVTVSAGDSLLDTPREHLAQTIWAEVAASTGLPAAPPAVVPPALPAWQIVRERRATFAATPAQDQKRPGTQTAWRNLFLAGDWTNTGLPATIEGAVRSGNRAAELLAANTPLTTAPKIQPMIPP